MKYNEIKQISRNLRKNQTDPEAQLWTEVRNRKLNGKKFTRQFPIIFESAFGEHFFYVADFYCHEHKLVIELDGPIHENQKERDKNRDSIMAGKGLTVLRIMNNELNDIEHVKDLIRSYLR